MTYYAYMNSPRRHTAPSTSRGYNRAVGVLTQADYYLISALLEDSLEQAQQNNNDEFVDRIKQLIWRVEQTGRLTR